MVQQPVSRAGDLGDTVTLHCQVDSNPPPVYTWTRGTSRQVQSASSIFEPVVWALAMLAVQAVGSSQNLTVAVSQRTEGEYYCHSISDGHPLLTSRAAAILLRRPPAITSPPVQVELLHGQHATVDHGTGGRGGPLPPAGVQCGGRAPGHRGHLVLPGQDHHLRYTAHSHSPHTSVSLIMSQ